MSTLKIETREQFEAFLEAAEVVCRLLLQSEHCEEALNEIIVVRDGVKSLTGLYDALRLRWVPVSERVPTEDGRYLIRVVTAGWPEKTPYTTVVSFHGGFYDSPNIWNITHWSSLPPLPEVS